MTKSPGSGAKKSGKKTLELPAVTLEETPVVAADVAVNVAERADASADVLPDTDGDSDARADVANPRETRELAAIAPDAPDAIEDPAPLAPTIADRSDIAGDDQESGPDAEMSGPALAALLAESDDLEDLDATVQRASVESAPPERPRHNTLASITRARGSTDPQGAPPPPPADDDEYEVEYDEPDEQAAPDYVDDGIPDETEGGGADEQEWNIADQPTVSLSHGSVLSNRPQFLDTDEHSSWPPRHAAELPIAGSLPEAAASLRRRAIPRPERTGRQRLASPTGRPMPATPPGGVPRSALPDPRMQRYQELHRRRGDAEPTEYDPTVERHVTDRVRQWWVDLRPGLQKALNHQHEERASGMHPIPSSEQAPVQVSDQAAEQAQSSRLGDVVGRLTASARDLTGRAQSAAAPAFKRLHNQAEHAAQAIAGRFESSAARQQEPLLGPGRIAVFFRPGVSVGQAQRLLASKDARPLRIIPRKHGFLAYVLPGAEEEVSNRLMGHPYVRDVQFIPVDVYGDPVEEHGE